MICRFENRLSGQALELTGFSHRIAACSAAQLDAAFAQIVEAQAQGLWIALLLDYELGEWLEPAVPSDATTIPPAVPSYPGPAVRPRFTALVFEQAQQQAVW